MIFIVVVAMVVVGLIMGWLAGKIWEPRKNDYLIGIISAVVIGVLDFYVIPAMGMSDSLMWLGVALEPALGALLILWLVRKAKK
jgi:uncharacterized membrane protein YeaQ/YmgE (transglycosylase-associated protein family)